VITLLAVLVGMAFVVGVIVGSYFGLLAASMLCVARRGEA